MNFFVTYVCLQFVDSCTLSDSGLDKSTYLLLKQAFKLTEKEVGESYEIFNKKPKNFSAKRGRLTDREETDRTKKSIDKSNFQVRKHLTMIFHKSEVLLLFEVFEKISKHVIKKIKIIPVFFVPMTCYKWDARLNSRKQKNKLFKKQIILWFLKLV